MKTKNWGTRFIKIFVSYMIVIFIPLSVISYISYSINVYKIKTEFEKNALRDLNNFSNTVENLLSGIENVSMQLSLTPSINKVLKDPFEVSMYEYLTLRQDLQKFCVPNQLFHSINLYIKLNNKVLTSGEGIYELNSFYDKNIILYSDSNDTSRAWYSSREIASQRSFDNAIKENVITFVRKIPITQTTPLGMLIVNIRTENLLKVIEQVNYSLNSEFLILDKDGNIVIGNGPNGFDKSLRTEVDTYLENAGSGIIPLKINNQQYTAAYLKQGYWTYFSLIPNKGLAEQILKERVQIARLYVLSLLFGIVLTYIISRKMYNPWKRLVAKIGEYLKSYGDDKNVNDEYNAVDKAIDSLIDRNQHIQAIIEENKPILKEKLVSDILWNNIENIEDINGKLEYVGLRFVHNNYLPLVVLVNAINEENEQSENVRLYVKDIIEREFSKTSIIASTLLDEDKIGFIINIEEHGEIKEKMILACRKVIEAIRREMKVFICFSFGSLCKELDDIEFSFANARRRLDYKPVINDGDILFEEGEEKELQYPTIIQRKITNGIITRNRNAVNEGVQQLFDQYINRPDYSKDQIQQMVLFIISRVIDKLWNDGEEKQIFNVEIYDIFKQIHKCKSADMLKDVIRNYFNGLMDLQPEQDSTSEKSYISSVMAYIENNYSKDISTVNIAESVGLNPSYLNRIFKRNTGKTLIEYLTLVRLKKAKELLSQNRVSINEISAEVGYNSLHSFIRAFKKYEGITPGEYRTRHFC